MEGTIFPILLLCGLCSLSSCLIQHHYDFFNTSKTWIEAQSYCRERCHDLATIDDMEEMQRVLKITENKYNDALWIGCKPVSKKGHRWSLADKDFYAEGETTWVLPFISGVYHCGTYKAGSFRRRMCDLNINSVCYDAKKEGEQRYVLAPVMSGWRAAQDYCRMHHTDLASVRNAEEEQILANVTGGLLAYFGLFRDAWSWSDGSDSTMRYWNPSQGVHPTSIQKCAAMLREEDGKWGERPCVEELPFLCNCPRPTRRVKVVVSSKSPTLDLNDPAVLDSILTHARSSLNTSLGIDDFRLRWTKQPDGEVFAGNNP